MYILQNFYCIRHYFSIKYKKSIEKIKAKHVNRKELLREKFIFHSFLSPSFEQLGHSWYIFAKCTWKISRYIFMPPPLDKGGILCRSVCRSVGRSVGRSRSNHSSQPSVLSAQYRLTPSLDQYQTWCRDCTQWVDDPYWFLGHIFKGQGQTTLFSPVY